MEQSGPETSLGVTSNIHGTRQKRDFTMGTEDNKQRELDVAIFIRSYKKDFEWLVWCIKSIDRYVTGYKELLLEVPDKDFAVVPKDVHDKVDHVFLRQERTHGYIDQQISKLQAHKRTDHQFILFVDSDCMFFTPCDVRKEFFVDGLPVMLKTPYSSFNPRENVLRWKTITQKALGDAFHVDYEYMRRFPLIYDRRTLEYLEVCYPNLEDYCCRQKDHEFSEFNVMGAFADKHHPHLYHWINTTNQPLPRTVAKQWWSYGGIRKDEKTFISTYLGND